MQKDKTSLILATTCPPVPFHGVERKVYMTAVPTSSSLRYVFNVTMSGERGAIGWDQMGENLILYLKLEEIDHVHFPDLEIGVEVWACFRVTGDNQ